MSELSQHLAECVADQSGEAQRGGALHDDKDSRNLIDGMIDAGWHTAVEVMQRDDRASDPSDALYDTMFSLFTIGFAAGREFERRGYTFAVEPSQVDLSEVPDSPEGLA
jgi:hypothetical protein